MLSQRRSQWLKECDSSQAGGDGGSKSWRLGWYEGSRHEDEQGAAAKSKWFPPRAGTDPE